MERNDTIDIMKGIGILLVMLGHFVDGFAHTFIYSFHMPLFFVLAGYFAKPIILNMGGNSRIAQRLNTTPIALPNHMYCHTIVYRH